MSEQGEKKEEVEQKPAATAEAKPARAARGRGQRGAKGEAQVQRPKTAKEPRKPKAELEEGKAETDGEKRVDNKGRGNRGGRGGQRQPRERSADSANRGGGRGGRGRGGTYAGRRDEPENKDSFKYKFHKPEFRTKYDYETVVITYDMDCEAFIAKEDILAEPDKEGMQKDLTVLDKDIEKIQKNKEKLILQKKKKLGGGRGGVAGTFFDQQKKLRMEHKGLNTGMHKLITEIKNLNTHINELDNQREKLLKMMDKNCTNEKEI
jgi:uncharacterized protein YukE